VTDPNAGSARQVRVFHHSAGAVILIDGRCLALRRAGSDEWIFPKGHLEEGERSEDAAIREVREETGLDIRILGPIGATRYSFGRGQSNRKRVDWFLAERIGGELTLERIFGEAVLLDPTDAQAVLTHKGDRDIAEHAFKLAAELGR
jgi:diadenosine hexaphosphate hydrolase (ATP-forming)